MNLDIEKVQALLKQESLDGWLFTDFHGHDYITREFLSLTDQKCSRRLFYLIPAEGEPIKILSAIEPLLLDHLPGKKQLYHGMKQQKETLKEYIRPGMKLACQYSPMGNVPTISSMDAGLVEYLKSFGAELVSSADQIQYFEAVLTDKQIESHRQAGIVIHRILDKSFQWIRCSLDEGKEIDEWMYLQEFKRLIAEEDIYMDSPPFFGIDDHGCDPGYEPKEGASYPIKEGSRLIVDIAGRLPGEDTVYYDVSWCMNVGSEIDPEYQKLFDAVQKVRLKALSYIQEKLDQGKPVQGCEVDAYVQSLFQDVGLDKYLMHRTGHNIGHNCHGMGANLDHYETNDVRRLLPGTMFSIEPGIYTEKYGVRLEFDVHITPEGKTQIYGPVQDKLRII